MDARLLGPGTELPPLAVPVTRTLIVAGAIASRDFQDVHHDVELARKKGSPDIFMNILTTNGLVGRYVTDFFGERAVLRRVAIRLGAPNHPGDTMVLRGTIGTFDGTTAEVRIVGANSLGNHVTGTVTVTLPQAGPRAGTVPRLGAVPRPDERVRPATVPDAGTDADAATAAALAAAVPAAAPAPTTAPGTAPHSGAEKRVEGGV
jgi:hypothetical protein